MSSAHSKRPSGLRVVIGRESSGRTFRARCSPTAPHPFPSGHYSLRGGGRVEQGVHMWPPPGLHLRVRRLVRAEDHPALHGTHEVLGRPSNGRHMAKECGDAGAVRRPLGVAGGGEGCDRAAGWHPMRMPRAWSARRGSCPWHACSARCPAPGGCCQKRASGTGFTQSNGDLNSAAIVGIPGGEGLPRLPLKRGVLRWMPHPLDNEAETVNQIQLV